MYEFGLLTVFIVSVIFVCINKVFYMIALTQRKINTLIIKVSGSVSGGGGLQLWQHQGSNGVQPYLFTTTHASSYLIDI